jgi:outer membrane lipoprotein carrier protein
VSASIIAAILSFLLTASAGNNVRSVVGALEARYRQARTLKASFFESYSDGSGGIAAESGTVYFSRPGRMRWEYESPEKKLFLVDGTNVWFYVPADHVASRAKMKQSSDWRTPLALLVGKANLSDLCRKIEIVEEYGKAASGPAKVADANDALLRCTPRDESGGPDQSIGNVLLETDPQGQLVRVVIHQAGNIETEFRFGNWEENLPIPEIKFHFQPPAGVSIVDQESLANEIH